MSEQNESKGAKVRFPPPLVFLGFIGLGVVLQLVEPLRIPFAFWPRLVVGVFVALCGVFSLLAANRWFVRTGQHPAPWKPSPELILEGIYRYTRNPMYLGMTLFQIGLGTALGNGWVVALAPVGLAIVHFLAVRPEEAYLSEKFGDGYLRYKAAVRRYL